MKQHVCILPWMGVGLIGWASGAHAADLSIYDVQHTTNPNGDSPYAFQIHNVTGGIVTHVWSGFNKRVYLQDPAHPTWGAIVVKDGEGGELADHVSVGDWVSFANIYIDEFRGTTMLQYRRLQAPGVSFTIESTANPIPPPVPFVAADLMVPANHSVSEPYESMAATLQGVTVGQKGLGKAGDNYELLQGTELAWGTDYMNIDAGAPYDPRIVTGALLESITGIVEQYTYQSWDYYQLCTRSAADIVPEPGTLLLLAGCLHLLLRGGGRKHGQASPRSGRRSKAQDERSEPWVGVHRDKRAPRTGAAETTQLPRKCRRPLRGLRTGCRATKAAKEVANRQDVAH